MGDPVVVESWYLPRALSDEALRLLTSLPMEEIERRLRMNEPAGRERPTDEELLRTYGLAKRDHNYEGPIDDWPNRAERAAVVAGLRAVLARWGTAPQAADEEITELVAWLRETGELLRSDIQYRFDLRLFYRAANLLELERQAAVAPVARLPEDAQAIQPANRTILVPVPAPIPVSERLPEKSEMTDDGEVWIEDPGGEYPLGDNDFDWEPHKWILGPITKYAIRSNRRWLAAHALPLPEVNDD